MLNFPEFSDLGSISTAQRSAWEGEISVRQKYEYYFSGLVFQEKVPSEVGGEEDAPALYPVGVNLVKLLCEAMADSELGEWEDSVVHWEPAKTAEVNDDLMRAVEVLGQITDSSSLNSLLWELCLDRNVFGGGAMKIAPSLTSPGHVKWSRVPLQSFFPVFDPDDPNVLLEVYAVVQMSQEQAKLKFGIEKSEHEMVTRVEHWTPFIYENILDGKRIEAFSGANPFGIVPFVFIPRLRSSHVYGDALTEDIIPSQNELNMRIADLGEVVNYNAHPVRWGLNLPRGFNARNFPLDPNAMWDLGRTIGNSPAPEVGMLEAQNPIPQGTFDYIHFLYDWSRTSSFAPPIAFGEDDGGGQRSGVTLEIRMWPLIKSVRRSRAYLIEGLLRAAQISAVILGQKNFSDVPVRALKHIADRSIVPAMGDIMPRDHQAVVDEVVKGLSTTPPSISLETACKLLGRGPAEVERIRMMLKDKDFYPEKQEPTNDLQEGMAGKMTPQTRKDGPKDVKKEERPE